MQVSPCFLHLDQPVSMLTRHRDRNPNGIVVNFRRDSDEEATRGRAGGGQGRPGARQGIGAQDIHTQSHLNCTRRSSNTESEVAGYTYQPASLTNIVYQPFDVSTPVANLAAQV